jgi:hypothetical protein
MKWRKKGIEREEERKEERDMKWRKKGIEKEEEGKEERDMKWRKKGIEKEEKNTKRVDIREGCTNDIKKIKLLVSIRNWRC